MNKKRIVYLLLIVMFCQLVSIQESSAATKDKEIGFSTKKITVTEGKKINIRLKKTTKKVKWKVTNKKVVKLIRKKGKRKNIIKIKGKFIGLDRLVENGFVLGRQAMVCCEEDTSLIGLVCISPLAKKLIPEEWIVVEGKISINYDPEYQVNIPILTVDQLEVVPPLKNQYVTFD